MFKELDNPSPVRSNTYAPLNAPSMATGSRKFDLDKIEAEIAVKAKDHPMVDEVELENEL